MDTLSDDEGDEEDEIKVGVDSSVHRHNNSTCQEKKTFPAAEGKKGKLH